MRNIADVYDNISKSTVCTKGRTARDVSREIAKVIFLGEYQEVDVQDSLARFSRRRRK
jgi:hypothetical protein